MRAVNEAWSPAPNSSYLIIDHEQSYSDAVTFLAGQTPKDDSSKRDPRDSAALTDTLLDCWRMLPSLSESILDGPLQRILGAPEHQRLRAVWQTVTAFSKAQLAGNLPL